MKKLLFSLLVFVSCWCTAEEWEKLPSLPLPCGGFSAGIREGQILIIGGTNWEGGVKNWLRTSYTFDPESLTWTKQPDLRQPVAYGMTIQTPRGPSIFGGSDGTRPLLNFDGQPDTVVLSAGGQIGDKIIWAGGMNDAANIAGVTRAAFAIKDRNVTKLPDYPGQPVAVAAYCVHGEELFVFGGLNYDSKTALPVNTKDGFAYSTNTGAWRPLRSLPEPVRGLSAIDLGDGRLYLAGGYSSDFSAKAWIYDINSDSYRIAKSLPYAAMVGLIVNGAHVYCMGGEDKMKSRTDKFFRISISALSQP